MKFSLLILYSGILFLAGCNTNDKSSNENAKVEVMDTVYDYADDSPGDSTLFVKNQSLLWHAEDSNGLKLQKPISQGIDTMSVTSIIGLINNNFDSIHLDYIRTSHDTIYIHIPNSDRLTERIGSTGAQTFMAATTYSLTEVKGIRYVNFDFVEGDHAAPGVYDRSYFRNTE